MVRAHTRTKNCFSCYSTPSMSSPSSVICNTLLSTVSSSSSPLYFYCFALYVLFFKILVFSLYFWNARNCFSQTTADKSHLEIWKIGSAVWSFEFRISFWIQFKFSPIKLFLVSCFLVFLKSSARAEKWMGSLNRIGYEVSETCCS